MQAKSSAQFDPHGSASSNWQTTSKPNPARTVARQLTPDLPRNIQHADERFPEKVLFPSQPSRPRRLEKITRALPEDAVNFMSPYPTEPSNFNDFSENSTTVQLNNYMLQSQLYSAFYGPSTLSLHHGRTQWLAMAIELPNKSRALSQALTAVSCSRLAWMSGDSALLQKSLSIYSRAIISTQNALWRKEQVWSDQTLAAIRLLQMYEAMESPSKSLRDYFMHVKGMGTYLVEKIKMDGQFQMDGLGHTLVKDYLVRSSIACFAHGDNIDLLVRNMVTEILPNSDSDQPSLSLVVRLSDFRFHLNDLLQRPTLAPADIAYVAAETRIIEQDIQALDDLAEQLGLYDDTESIYHHVLSHTLRIFLSTGISPFAELLPDAPDSPPRYPRASYPPVTSAYDEPAYRTDSFSTSPRSGASMPTSSRADARPLLSHIASAAYRQQSVTRIGNLLHLITGTSALDVVLASNLIWALNPWRGADHVPSGRQFASNTGLKVANLFEAGPGVAASVLPKGLKGEYEASGAKGFGSRSSSEELSE